MNLGLWNGDELDLMVGCRAAEGGRQMLKFETDSKAGDAVA
jgi:hypothetical protein